MTLSPVAGIHTTPRQISRAAEPVAAIVDRARGGDREAFADLYVRYRLQIYTYLLRRTHNRELSEDLTGDVFVRALDRIGTFTWHGRDVGAWLATIARNLLLDHYKSSRCRREIPTGDMYDRDLNVADIGEQVTEYLARAELIAELHNALAELSPDQRECLRLRYWHDLPFDEIGRRMDRSVYAAKMLKERALRNLSAPHIQAALLELTHSGRSMAPMASGSRAVSPSPTQACAAPHASPCVPSPRRPAPSNHLAPGRSRSMATPDKPATLAPLTVDQAVALVLLRDGFSERSITQRTGIPRDALYRLAAAYAITAPHGTVEGHRCHEAADKPEKEAR
ncbi:RNA polymerase sigma factor [Streptomyces sp. WAC05858]|uniref:RNA polymerase sigma factor n=1 Tax=Streptomyces TaxID=1883 RepID=UPI000F79C90E|nr:sigma-70 family RNA polymerase sigma factor [Streptomyces sp. WAC05858]RSS34556.1 sigma-70 family RNA polymerase sigma factor [Streptomyces sp. WAC05858]